MATQLKFRAYSESIMARGPVCLPLLTDAGTTSATAVASVVTASGTSYRRPVSINASTEEEIVWVSPPLSSTHSALQPTIQLWAYESSMAANMRVGYYMAKYTGDGTGLTQFNTNTETNNLDDVELGTGAAAMIMPGATYSQSLAVGDRIVVRVLAANIGGAADGTMTFNYGAASGSNFFSYVEFTSNMTFSAEPAAGLDYTSGAGYVFGNDLTTDKLSLSTDAISQVTFSGHTLADYREMGSWIPTGGSKGYLHQGLITGSTYGECKSYTYSTDTFASTSFTTSANTRMGSINNSTVGFGAGGQNSGTRTTAISGMTFSTETTTSPGSVLGSARDGMSCHSYEDHGIIAGGDTGTADVFEAVKYVFATNAVSVPATNLSATCGAIYHGVQHVVYGNTRGYLTGAFNPAEFSAHYLTKNSTTVSNGSSGLSHYCRGGRAAGFSSSTYGYMAGGKNAKSPWGLEVNSSSGDPGTDIYSSISCRYISKIKFSTNQPMLSLSSLATGRAPAAALCSTPPPPISGTGSNTFAAFTQAGTGTLTGYANLSGTGANTTTQSSEGTGTVTSPENTVYGTGANTVEAFTQIGEGVVPEQFFGHQANLLETFSQFGTGFRYIGSFVDAFTSAGVAKNLLQADAGQLAYTLNTQDVRISMTTMSEKVQSCSSIFSTADVSAASNGPKGLLSAITYQYKDIRLVTSASATALVGSAINYRHRSTASHGNGYSYNLGGSTQSANPPVAATSIERIAFSDYTTAAMGAALSSARMRPASVADATNIFVVSGYVTTIPVSMATEKFAIATETISAAANALNINPPAHIACTVGSTGYIHPYGNGGSYEDVRKLNLSTEAFSSITTGTRAQFAGANSANVVFGFRDVTTASHKRMSVATEVWSTWSASGLTSIGYIYVGGAALIDIAPSSGTGANTPSFSHSGAGVTVAYDPRTGTGANTLADFTGSGTGKVWLAVGANTLNDFTQSATGTIVEWFGEFAAQQISLTHTCIGITPSAAGTAYLFGGSSFSFGDTISYYSVNLTSGVFTSEGGSTVGRFGWGSGGECTTATHGYAYGSSENSNGNYDYRKFTKATVTTAQSGSGAGQEYWNAGFAGPSYAYFVAGLGDASNTKKWAYATDTKSTIAFTIANLAATEAQGYNTSYGYFSSQAAGSSKVAKLAFGSETFSDVLNPTLGEFGVGGVGEDYYKVASSGNVNVSRFSHESETLTDTYSNVDTGNIYGGCAVARDFAFNIKFTGATENMQRFVYSSRSLVVMGDTIAGSGLTSGHATFSFPEWTIQGRARNTLDDIYITLLTFCTGANTVEAFTQWSIGTGQTPIAGTNDYTTGAHTSSGEAHTFPLNKAYFAGGGTLITLYQSIDYANMATDSFSLHGYSLSANRTNEIGISGPTYGYFCGGYTTQVVNSIERIHLFTGVTATTALTISNNRQTGGGVESATRGYVAGGYNYTPTYYNTIDGVIFSGETTFTASYTLSAARHAGRGVHSETKGYFGGGLEDGSFLVDEIDGINMQTEAANNPSAVLARPRMSAAGVSAYDHGIWASGNGFDGENTVMVDEIDGITFATEAATNQSAATGILRYEHASASSLSDGYLAGGVLTEAGNNPSAAVEKISFMDDSISTIGGTLNAARYGLTGVFTRGKKTIGPGANTVTLTSEGVGSASDYGLITGTGANEFTHTADSVGWLGSIGTGSNTFTQTSAADGYVATRIFGVGSNTISPTTEWVVDVPPWVPAVGSGVASTVSAGEGTVSVGGSAATGASAVSAGAGTVSVTGLGANSIVVTGVSAATLAAAGSGSVSISVLISDGRAYVTDFTPASHESLLHGVGASSAGEPFFARLEDQQIFIQ